LQNLAKGKLNTDRKWKAKLHEGEDTKHKEKQDKDIYWEKPVVGWVKPNVDASFISNQKNGA
jgi:hypothetical protein